VSPGVRWGLTAACLALFGCASRVQHGLDERQANEIQAVLLERGFRASKVSEDARPPTWAIEVPARDGSEAVRILAGLGLPRPRPAGVKELLRPGLVPDPLEQHVLLLEAQSGELARTLEGVDGVLSARVHLVRPTPARGGGVAAPAKAAVYLRVGSSAYGRLGAMREDLRSLVAGSVEGLDPGGVTLVLSEVASPVVARSDARLSTPGSVPLLPLGVGMLCVSAAAGGWLLRRRVRAARAPRGLPASLAIRPVVQAPLTAGNE
jgi:type III secretion protein J